MGTATTAEGALCAALGEPRWTGPALVNPRWWQGHYLVIENFGPRDWVARFVSYINEGVPRYRTRGGSLREVLSALMAMTPR